MGVWSLRARWLLPMDRPPIPGGVVVGDGERIVAVGDRATDPGAIDLGDAAIIPGLVNAHTHLDLCGLRGRLLPSDFVPWLRAVSEHRRTRTLESTAKDVREGLRECVRFGTTLVGDISAGGASWPALAGGPVRAVVFRELIGLKRDRAETGLRSAVSWLRAHPPTAWCRPALSPHAPYSVRHSLYRAVGRACDVADTPVATHLAESADERELLDRRCGPLRDLAESLGAWDAAGPARGFGEVLRALPRRSRVLLVHGNYLEGEPLPDYASVVFCPRTHARFGHPPHPLPALLRRGVRVALGTDGLGSSPDLDVLAEARLVRQTFPKIPAETVLAMATLWGAEALGCAGETGSLTPGKSADLVVVPLDGVREADPSDFVLRLAGHISGVMVRGRWLWSGFADGLRASFTLA